VELGRGLDQVDRGLENAQGTRRSTSRMVSMGARRGGVGAVPKAIWQASHHDEARILGATCVAVEVTVPYRVLGEVDRQCCRGPEAEEQAAAAHDLRTIRPVSAVVLGAWSPYFGEGSASE
jgi:hypothetical protein